MSKTIEKRLCKNCVSACSESRQRKQNCFSKLLPPSKPKRKAPSLNFHVDIRNTVTSISASSPSLTVRIK